MSYKTTVLADYPLAYYPLDDLTTGEVPDFNDLMSQFDTYQEVLDFYSSYSNMSGTTAYDYSGCNNYGVYSGAPETRIIPIVPGNSMATKITDTLYVSYILENNFYSNQVTDLIGTKYSSGVEFSIECWIYPKVTSTSEIPLVGDSLSNVGLFYEAGNINFKLNSQTLSYTVMNPERALHIVAVYAVNYMYLFIDGVLVNAKPLSGFTFTNTDLSLKTGPSVSTSYFLVNSVAVYSYALPANKVASHYNAAFALSSSEIVYPSEGELFKIFDNSPSYEFKYSYPGNKPWIEFTSSDLGYNQSENSLSMVPTATSESKTVILEDYISIPISYTLDSSKIEWDATSGVSVEASVDGENYIVCKNNFPIPGYESSSFDTSRQLYLKITMESSDATKFIPRIKNLIVKFYSNQILYSSNGPAYISTLEGESGVSVFDIAIGNSYSNILWRNQLNGIKVKEDSGFFLNSSKSIQAIEFFYTPSQQADSGLIYEESSSTNYEWHTSGSVSKDNIDFIAVNGVDCTSETSAYNIFKSNNLHHVFIRFSEPISGQIKFLGSSYGCPESIIQNIAIYESDLDLSDAVSNFNLYRYAEVVTVSDLSGPSIRMTENSANYYNNDWNVIISA